MFQTVAFRVVREFVLHIVRQHLVLGHQMGVEFGAMLLDDPVQQRLLELVVLMTNSAGPCASHPGGKRAQQKIPTDQKARTF